MVPGVSMGGAQGDEQAGAGPGGLRRALVVEDAVEIQDVVTELLRAEGFEVRTAADGERAVEVARSFEPDLVILDVRLPGIDGVQVCQRIRTFSDAFVIMLTAKADEVDKVVGLSVGADDYVTKPFSRRELMARVQVLFRRVRTTGPSSRERVFGDLIIDPDAREVRVAGRTTELTRIEFDLLDTLSGAPRMAFSRRQLQEAVWGEDWYGDDHAVDVHVSNLRRKLEPDSPSPRYIRTVRGIGYRMGDGTSGQAG
jgi:DNA-binding response OmpR family regulator